MPAWARQRTFPCTRSELLIRKRAREERRQVYEWVKELRRQGLGIATILRKLIFNRRTVWNCTCAYSLHECGRQAVREGQLNPYLPYLHAQREAGRESASQLWLARSKNTVAPAPRSKCCAWGSACRFTPLKHPRNRPVSTMSHSPPRNQAAPPAGCCLVPNAWPDCCARPPPSWVLQREPPRRTCGMIPN